MNCNLVMIVCFVLSVARSYGATITAIASGSWTSNSTWSCTCQPGNADNIVIPAGITVTDNGPAILFLGPVITITINGTLALVNGSLQIDASDVIKINTGGKITGTGVSAVYSGVIPIFVTPATTITGPKTITNGTLPVTLLFFNSDFTSTAVDLLWASASELNFNYYRIARSHDGIRFDSIGNVKSTGNSTQRNDYNLRDEAPLTGVSYYRLQAIDLDGNVSVSREIEIDLTNGTRVLTIFPNPVSGERCTARLNFYPEEGGNIAVYNSYGNRVFEYEMSPSINQYDFTWTAHLQTGIYVVIVSSKEGSFKSKIIVP